MGRLHAEPDHGGGCDYLFLAAWNIAGARPAIRIPDYQPVLRALHRVLARRAAHYRLGDGLLHAAVLHAGRV